jgi:hypothetical protein
MCTAELVEYYCPAPDCQNMFTAIRVVSKDHDPVCDDLTMLPVTQIEEELCMECEEEAERKRQEQQPKQLNGGPGYP